MMNPCLRAPVMMSLMALISIALMAATPAAPEAPDKTKERSCTGDVPSWYCEAPKGSSAASGDSRAEALAWALRELAAHQQALVNRLIANYAQPSKEEKASKATDQFVCGFKVKGMVKRYKADPEPGTTNHKEELSTIVASVQLVQNKFKRILRKSV